MCILELISLHHTHTLSSFSPCRYEKVSRKAAKVAGKGGNRWYKSVGLGFKTPKEAIEGKTSQPPDS